MVSSTRISWNFCWNKGVLKALPYEPSVIILSIAVPCREAGTGLPAASPYAVGVKDPGEIAMTALPKAPFLRPLKPWSDSNEAGACRRPALPGLRLQKKRSPKAAFSMKGTRCPGSFLPLVTSDHQRPVTERLPAAAVLFTGSQNPRSGSRPGRRSSAGWLFPPGCPRS